MARLPDQLIDRIKQDVSLVRLIEAKGFELKRHGRDYAMCCPFHDDKTASLIVTPAKNLWHCMGACQEGGSVIDWVMKTEGVSFRHAVELLRNEFLPFAQEGDQQGTVADSNRPAPKVVKQNTRQKLPTPFTQSTPSGRGADSAADADHQDSLRQVIDYYHETLKTSPDVLDYLEKRGLKNTELIDTFKLGYANRTLAYRLPQKKRQAGAEIRGKLQAVGILRQTGHEHFNGCLVVPVMDDQGVITDVYGRKTQGNRLKKGCAQHLYLPGPHEGVWNLQGLQHSDEVILCESLIDAMTFWVHGFKHVTASYGTAGFTSAHLAAFKQYHIKRVLIAYDRDEAGNKAAEQLADTLDAEGLTCYRVLFPKGMDANEYAIQMSPPAKALGLVIRKAEWVSGGQSREVDKEPIPAVTAATSPLAAEPLEQPAGSLSAPVDAAADADTPQDSNSQTQAAVVDPQHLLDQQATPAPGVPSAGVEVQHGHNNELLITLGDRRYRVRGLERNSGYDQLKIQLLVRRDITAGEGLEQPFHMDKLDLYASKQRQVFINQASAELGVKDEVIKTDLGKVLLALEAEQAQQAKPDAEPKPTELAPGAREEALALLRDPDLLNRILNDFALAGVVGEEANKLAGYLSCVSRKLDRPLAVIIQSSSAAGKSSLMDAILALMPEEERVQYSAMTGQSLFYMGETNLKHKILAIAEEEGASNASYALKLLQSEGEVTIASTGKDDTTGNLVTKEYKVEGPVMLFLTTTAIDIDEELLNRCLVLTVNESREQTQAIHQAQRAKRTLQGLQHKLDKDRILHLHRNAQRLLKSLAVINPYADQLTFLDDKTRTRRDHEKYLTLIDSIALLHQHQREIKTVESGEQQIDYVEVTLTDIETANRLAHDILGRTLDELPPQTRKLLTLITDWLNTQCQHQGIEQAHFRFSRRQVRQLCGWSETQVRVHMQRLVSMEYLLVHRGGRGQSFEYELLYSGEGDQGDAFLMRLLDVKKLKAATTTSTSRSNSGEFAGSTRPQRGATAGPSQSDLTPIQPSNGEGYREYQLDHVENAYRPVKTPPASHRTDSPALVAEAAPTN